MGRWFKMKFKATSKYLENYLKVKSKEIGFFIIYNPYNEVVFKTTKDNIYFNAYGNILKRV